VYKALGIKASLKLVIALNFELFTYADNDVYPVLATSSSFYLLSVGDPDDNGLLALS